jgi:hypothetical protein
MPYDHAKARKIYGTRGYKAWKAYIDRFPFKDVWMEYIHRLREGHAQLGLEPPILSYDEEGEGIIVIPVKRDPSASV